MRLANALDRVLVYDPKGDDPEVLLPNATRVWGVDAARKALPGRVIYHPTARELADPALHFDRLVEKIWSGGGHHGIVVNETCDVGDAMHGFRTWLSVACRQGRGRAVTRIFCSQRPVSDVPRLAISETKHYVAFFLQDEDDRRRLAKYMGPEVVERQEFNHDYWYCGRGSAMRAVRCSAI